MNSTEGFRPDWTSPPGSTIRSILRERELSKVDLSERIGLRGDDLEHLLEGRLTISIKLARKLAEFLGASVEFWVSRDFQYQKDVARLREADEQWLSELPIDDMITFGWFEPPLRPQHKLSACLEFFGVPNVSEWNRTYQKMQPQIAFRTSPKIASNPAAVAAWLRKGEIEATMMDCIPWNPVTLRQNISSIRALTRRKDPRLFLPALKRYCAASGVAIAIVRTPRGCPASGAVRFLNPQQALVQMSFRYLSDDHFWFTLFHEIGHLLLHEPAEILLESPDDDSPTTQKEKEANEFAANILVPIEHKKFMMGLGTNPHDLIRFARRIGISPGIVVGQLQHLGIFRYGQMNSLKRRYTWETE